MTVDLRPDHLEIVKRILVKRVPEYQVRAFGSRVRWTAAPRPRSPHRRSIP